VQAGGGLVEDEELVVGCGGAAGLSSDRGGEPSVRCLRAGSGGAEQLAEFEALGLATGEGVEGLAKLEITETDFEQRLQGGEGLSEQARLPRRAACGVGREEVDGVIGC